MRRATKQKLQPTRPRMEKARRLGHRPTDRPTGYAGNPPRVEKERPPAADQAASRRRTIVAAPERQKWSLSGPYYPRPRHEVGPVYLLLGQAAGLFQRRSRVTCPLELACRWRCRRGVRIRQRYLQSLQSLWVPVFLFAFTLLLSRRREFLSRIAISAQPDCQIMKEADRFFEGSQTCPSRVSRLERLASKERRVKCRELIPQKKYKR